MDNLSEDQNPGVDFDVALSFAGAHRDFVRKIAERLKALGISVFFDEFAKADAWGKNLYEYFDTAYRARSRYVVAFFSAEYAEGDWTRHEQQSAQVQALAQDAPYLLPVRMDDSVILGLRSTTAYIDARIEGIDGLVELVIAKVRPSTFSENPIPTTEAQVERLINAKPPLWEYQLFAGLLNQGINSLDYKWRDHRIELCVPGNKAISEDEIQQFCLTQQGKIISVVDNLNRILAEEAVQEAFGPPGVAGDDSAISYLVKRLVDVYDQLMDWALETRSANVPSRYAGVVWSLSQFARQPIEELREFRDRFTDFVLALPAWLAIPEGERTKIESTFEVTFRIDDAVSELFADECDLARNS